MKKLEAFPLPRENSNQIEIWDRDRELRVKKVSIVDYGRGNLWSVQKAFEKVQSHVEIVKKPEDVTKANALVLPGVGAFKDAFESLKSLDLVEPIKEHVNSGKPFLGVCLGMQLLFTESEEFGGCRGFDIFKGKIVRFVEIPGFKVPHMGWNQVHYDSEISIMNGIPQDSFFYFVHSYYIESEDNSLKVATTDYSIKFISMISKDNIFATQFHPEKSQEYGLKMLSNFVKLL